MSLVYNFCVIKTSSTTGSSQIFLSICFETKKDLCNLSNYFNYLAEITPKILLIPCN